LKVKTILVSQPQPEGNKSPFCELAEKHKIKVDFRKFIHVEGITAVEFRKQKVNVAEHTAVVMTSKSSVDHYFRLCKELRFNVPETMKYFCLSEAIALYLQKYVLYRKRKVFHGKQSIGDLMLTIKKHKTDKFLLPCSDKHKEKIADELDINKIEYAKAVMYRTVCSDLSDLEHVNYDMLVFFSPTGIKSLFENFPKFKQNKTRIACFGHATKQAVEEAGLTLNVHAPTPEAPSMTMAIEQYIEQVKKLKK
jgi:uroporphyrinogen-III synthase